MTQRQEIIERLNGLELEWGSHEMLSAICKAVLPHGDAWTLRRCCDLRDRLVRLLGEADAAMAERYVELPKDADGEVIHLGDVVMLPDWPLNHHEVINLVYAHDGWAIISRHGSIEASEHTVHVKPKKPTVEDVLREMADRCYADEDEPRDRDAIVAEYAAKLRLAGDAE